MSDDVCNHNDYVKALNRQVYDCYTIHMDAGFGVIRLFDSDLFEYEIQEMPSVDGDRLYRLIGNRNLFIKTDLVEYLFKDAYNRYKILIKHFEPLNAVKPNRQNLEPLIAKKPKVELTTQTGSKHQLLSKPILDAIMPIIKSKLGANAEIAYTISPNSFYRMQLITYLYVYEKVNPHIIAYILGIRSVDRYIEKLKQLQPKIDRHIIKLNKMLFDAKKKQTNIFGLNAVVVITKLKTM